MDNELLLFDRIEAIKATNQNRKTTKRNRGTGKCEKNIELMN